MVLVAHLLKTKKEFKNIFLYNKNYTYKNSLDKTCFQHDMAYGNYKDLVKRTESDKVLSDKAFKIAKNPKYNGYERGLTSMVYKFLIKILQVNVLNLCQINNLQMNLINQLLENLKDSNSILLLKTKIGELILLICNYAIKCLLCVIGIFSKYAWAVLLKNKKMQLILIHFKLF